MNGLIAKINDIEQTMSLIDRFSTPESSPEPDVVWRYLRTVAGLEQRSLTGAISDASSNGDYELERALSATVAAAGGFAVPSGYAAEVIEFLRPLVAVRALDPVVVPMPNGNLTFPSIQTPSTASFINENVPVPPTQPVFGALNLVARKMAGLIPISNSLMRFARPSADQIVSNDIIATIAQLEDAAFIRGDGTEFTPKGLRYWAPAQNVIPSNQTLSIANTDADLASLETALTSQNVRMIRPGWMFSPTVLTYLMNLRGSGGNKAYPELDKGMLRGKPFRTTNNIPTNLGTGGAYATEIYLADFADVVIGEAGLVVGASAVGLYTDAGGNQVAAFSQDQTLVRVVSLNDIGMRHPQSVAVLVNCIWGSN